MGELFIGNPNDDDDDDSILSGFSKPESTLCLIS